MLYLTKKQAEELIEHSKRESPNEACGILAGKQGRVEKVYQMINTDKSTQTFFMEPKDQLRVTKEIRNLKLQMVGIYHSHLETEAYPSAHDIELAYYPEASYVIVSIKDKGNPSIRSFRIIEGKVTKEEVKVVDG
jgi:proteasome lid subunit RPN8/RPN11